MLEILAEVVQVFLDLIPRPGRIDSTHGAVSVWFGKWQHTLSPGVYLQWPAVREVQPENLMERSNETAVFGVTTRDGFAYQCRIVVLWHVDDLLAYHFGSSCGATFVEQRAQCLATSAIGSMDCAALMRLGFDFVGSQVTGDLADDCSERGIAVSSVRFNLCTMAIPVLHAYAEQTVAD